MKIDEVSEDGYIAQSPLSKFNFSATIGFGIGFFEKLNIIERNVPKKLKAMPDFLNLADRNPYSLLQTDLIIQFGSEVDYVNRWVFRNQIGITKKNERKSFSYNKRLSRVGSEMTGEEDIPDIYSVIRPWAKITDIHAGFQRLDGRNLLGFNDGISNPPRLSNNVVWTTSQDEDKKFQDGTYMVFQKIEHDLEQWQNLDIEKQERWIGRSKGTGLLLGTLSKEDDQKLASGMHSNNELTRNAAVRKWKKLYDQQKDPEVKFYDPARTQFRNIQVECPVWSHVRKANPRQADGVANILIFRRGYVFIDDGENGKSSSGLLFICFQKDIEKGFEYIKTKFLSNENFPVPQQRKRFNNMKLKESREQIQINKAELQEKRYGDRIKPSAGPDVQTTGREGLSGPSELGVYPHGQFPITNTLGGGYYFIPPIPNKRISDISEQFFI